MRLRHTPRFTLFPYTTLFRSIMSEPFRLKSARPFAPNRIVKTHWAARCGLRTLGDVLSYHRQAQRLQQRVDMVQRARSEEHTSELQSREKIVCWLLLKQKKVW